MTDIVISSFADARTQAAGFDAVISIESPGATLETGQLPRFRRRGEPAHTVLCFRDIEDAALSTPPQRHQIEAGLRFARQHAARRLLIHCFAGVSRSTALAYAILIDRAGAEADERGLLDRLLALRPQACPNRLMVRHADALLDRGGRMLDAVEAHPTIIETRRRNFSPPSR